MKFRLGELFCGPGGLGLAAQLAVIKSRSGETFGIDHVWATDYDGDSCNSYRHNITPSAPETVICEDVRNLVIPKLGAIDAFAYGFPCNDFSIVGESRGLNGTFGPLYSYGVTVLHAFKPKWFLAENVGGLASANDGKTFKLILRDLANAGYLLTVHSYNFNEYSVPQIRKRIIIVGILQDENKIFRVPKPSGKLITCREALHCPEIPFNAPNNELTRQSATVIERLKHIKPGQNAWTANLPENLKLNVKGAKLSQIYKRLDPDKPAYTMTGSGGGGTHGYHWEENRALTNRERARLQTFPDDYIFHGSKESVRKQIGMSVPVSGAKAIFNAILKTFADIPYANMQPNFGYVLPSDSMKEATLCDERTLSQGILPFEDTVDIQETR